jgi:hypothetical protein
VLKIVKELHRLEQDRDAYLRRCGFYNRAEDYLPRPDDPQAEDADLLRQVLLGAVVSDTDDASDGST